jgi:hypothetical protein
MKQVPFAPKTALVFVAIEGPIIDMEKEVGSGSPLFLVPRVPKHWSIRPLGEKC